MSSWYKRQHWGSSESVADWKKPDKVRTVGFYVYKMRENANQSIHSDRRQIGGGGDGGWSGRKGLQRDKGYWEAD